MLFGQWTLKVISIELALLFGTQHKTNLLNAALHKLFKKYEDDRTNETIGTGNREKVFLQGTGGGIEPCSEACNGNDSTAHGMNRLQCEHICLHTVIIKVIHQLSLRLLVSCQELNRAVTMGANSFSAPNHRLDLGVLQDSVEFGRNESGRHWCHLGIEKSLCLGHQTTQSFCITFCHILDGAVYNVEVLLSQSFMFCTLGISCGEGIGLVQIGQDLDSVFLGTQIGKDPEKMFPHVKGANLNLIAIERHQVWLHTESTGLIQTTTAAASSQFSQIGDIHFA